MEISVKVVLVAGSPGATGGQVGQAFVTVIVRGLLTVWVTFLMKLEPPGQVGHGTRTVSVANLPLVTVVVFEKGAAPELVDSGAEVLLLMGKCVATELELELDATLLTPVPLPEGPTRVLLPAGKGPNPAAAPMSARR